MMTAEQVPGVQRRKVGDIVVTALNDGYIMLPDEVLLGASSVQAAALYHKAGRRRPVATAINAYLVQSAGRLTLVDTGCGRFMGPTLGKLPRNLAAVGVTPADIDVIVVTHMHPDHVGGLLTDEGGRAYPKAQLRVAEEELGYWLDDANRASSPPSTLDSFDIVALVMSAYAGDVDSFSGAGELVPGVSAVPLPGHTPGHTGFAIGDRRTDLLIWGDISHAPELQLPRPEIGVVFDVDPAQAAATRRDIIARAADEDLLVAGMHIPFPGFIRIHRTGDSYVFHPQVFQYDLAE